LCPGSKCYTCISLITLKILWRFGVLGTSRIWNRTLPVDQFPQHKWIICTFGVYHERQSLSQCLTPGQVQSSFIRSDVKCKQNSSQYAFNRQLHNWDSRDRSTESPQRWSMHVKQTGLGTRQKQPSGRRGGKRLICNSCFGRVERSRRRNTLRIR
jgi:hypothetical protein